MPEVVDWAAGPHCAAKTPPSAPSRSNAAHRRVNRLAIIRPLPHATRLSCEANCAASEGAGTLSVRPITPSSGWGAGWPRGCCRYVNALQIHAITVASPTRGRTYACAATEPGPHQSVFDGLLRVLFGAKRNSSYQRQTLNIQAEARFSENAGAERPGDAARHRTADASSSRNMTPTRLALRSPA